jgi:RHS repeat-associated protein
MSDASGTSSDSYDPFGELTSAVNGAGQTVGYGYNADGQVTGITYPLGSAATWATSDTVGYGYDDAGELTSVTDFTGHQISIANTADGLPGSVGLGSTGDTISTTYDGTDRPSAISLKNSGSTLQSFTYSDSPAGTVLSETDTPSSSNSPTDYSYDAKGRVISDTPGTGTVKDYGFDASDNLTTLPTGATTTYNDASELTFSALSGTTTSYTYNADGEQTGSAQGPTAESAGTWNGAQEAATYDNSAADMTAATYNGDGLRTSSTITPAGGSSVTQGYVWNTIPGLPNLLVDGTSAYIYATGNTPAEQVNLSTGTPAYLVTDSLGSVRGIVSSSGDLTGTTAYDAWGNPETAGGLTAATPFGYAGGYTDPDGLIYLINRYYQPSTGQFISVDPDVSQTLTPYAYAGDDPVLNSDPTGLKYAAGGCQNRSTKGLKVQVCIELIDTDFGGRWNMIAFFRVKSGKIKETGANSIGMNVCGEGPEPKPGFDKNCGTYGVVFHARGDASYTLLSSGSYLSGVDGGYNWILGWGTRVWAESSTGHKTQNYSRTTVWVKTCSKSCV